MLNFHKVTALPGSPQPDGVYFELAGANIIGYVVDTGGTARPFFNQALVDARITAQLAGISQVVRSPDFATATASASTESANQLVLVADASGDPTVDAGAAMYFLDATADTLEKVTEFESLDVTLDWADIQNGPASTPAQIDAAATLIGALTVSATAINAAIPLAHTHTNKTALDAITDTNGDGSGTLLFNGNEITPTLDWTTLAW